MGRQCRINIGEGVVLGIKRSPWANPYSITAEHDREWVINEYRAWLKKELQEPFKLAAFNALQGKTLGCWCKPENCHGDVILEHLQSLQLQPVVARVKLQLPKLRNPAENS